MSKFYLFLTLILIFFCTTKSQSRFPLNPKSAWRVDSLDFVLRIAEKTKFFIKGDTTIANIKYYKLYKSGEMTLDEPFYYNNIYVGAIRDDNNKIFFINQKTSKIRLLFDFNLNVGDTIKSEIGFGNTIISIDTTNKGRKIFNYDLSFWNIAYIIEGIGTNGGLFSPGTTYKYMHFGQEANFLICYTEDGVLKYQCNENLAKCDIFTNYDDIRNSSYLTDIKVYPVPTNGQLFIESQAENVLKSVEVFSIIGEKVLAKDISENNSFTLNLSELKNGIYILKVKGNGSITTHRIIKV